MHATFTLILSTRTFYDSSFAYLREASLLHLSAISYCFSITKLCARCLLAEVVLPHLLPSRFL